MAITNAAGPLELTTSFDSLFPEQLPKTQNFLDSLGVFGGESPFYPTEFSVTLGAGERPRWGTMCQLRRSSGFRADLVLARALSSLPDAGIQDALRELFALVYSQRFAKRFGIGIEAGSSRPVTTHVFFDLFAGGARMTAVLRRTVLAQLGFDDPVTEIPVRTLGVEFEHGRITRATLYFAAYHAVTAPRSTMCTQALNTGARTLHWYLPDLYSGDQAASLAIESALEHLRIEPRPYRQVRNLMLQGTPLGSSRGVQQYLSIDAGSSQVKVCFRPRVFGSDWLPVTGRPQKMDAENERAAVQVKPGPQRTSSYGAGLSHSYLM
jgi:hypothetical protein